MRRNLWILCGTHSCEGGWSVGLGLRLCPLSCVSTNSPLGTPDLLRAEHSHMYQSEHWLPRNPGLLPEFSIFLPLTHYFHTTRQTPMPQSQVFQHRITQVDEQ